MIKKASSSDAGEGKVLSISDSGSVKSAASPAPLWQVQTVYQVGSIVTFGGLLYVCIQAHTSLEGWEPPKTPALWVRSNDETPGPDPNTPPDTELVDYRNRSLALPLDVDLKPIIADEEDGEGGGDHSDEAEAGKIIERHASLSAAVTELLAVPPADYQSNAKTADGGSTVDEQFNAETLQTRQLQLHSSFGEAIAGRLREPGAGSGPDGISSSTADLAKGLLAAPEGLMPNVAFAVVPEEESSLLLKQSAPLSTGTKTLLSAKGIDFTKVPIDSKPCKPASFVPHC